LILTFQKLGAGISEENQKRLFNEIVQFNPEVLQAGGGSGLGLWITRGIVDLHNSTISVFSAGKSVNQSVDMTFNQRMTPSIESHYVIYPEIIFSSIISVDQVKVWAVHSHWKYPCSVSATRTTALRWT
jgi:two-component system, sensor histidine kinase